MRAERVRLELLRFLLDCRDQGKRVVGYGALGKGNTLLNYCGIRPDLLEYTVDRNPQGTAETSGHPDSDSSAGAHRRRPARCRARPAVESRKPRSPPSLRHVGDWGGELIYPLPVLHRAGTETKVNR